MSAHAVKCVFASSCVRSPFPLRRTGRPRQCLSLVCAWGAYISSCGEERSMSMSEQKGKRRKKGEGRTMSMSLWP